MTLGEKRPVAEAAWALFRRKGAMEPLADRVIQRIGQAEKLYYRLVILLAPVGGGKTAALQDVHERTTAPLVNVGLELSCRMLELTTRQRVLQLPRLLSEVAQHAATRGNLARQHRGFVRRFSETRSAAAPPGVVEEQDGSDDLERLRRGHAYRVRDARSPRVQTESAPGTCL